MGLKFYIHGYYGNQNLGDEAILTVLADNFRKIWPDCQISIISADDKSPKRVGVNRVSDWRESIHSSDIVIFGGGGMFDDAGPNGWRDQVPMFKEIWYAFANKKPIIFFAVGAGPYYTLIGRMMLAIEAWLADLITARDNESKELLIRYLPNKKKVYQTGDLALLLREAEPQDLDSNFIKTQDRLRQMPHPRIGVNLFSFSELVHRKPEEDKRRREIVSSAFDSLFSANGGSAIFLSAQGLKDGYDFLEAERTIELIRNKDRCLNVPYFANPVLYREIVKDVDCLVGMKLHSLIFAYGAMKPVISLSYHPKTISFMKMVGAEDFSLPLQELSGEALTNLVRKALSGGWQSEDEQRARWEKIKRGAQLNFEILEKHLSKIL